MFIDDRCFEEEGFGCGHGFGHDEGFSWAGSDPETNYSDKDCGSDD